MALTEAAVQRHAPGPPRGGWPSESSHRHLAGASQPSGEGEPGPRLLASEARTRYARHSLYLTRWVFPSGQAVRGQPLSLPLDPTRTPALPGSRRGGPVTVTVGIYLRPEF